MPVAGYTSATESHGEMLRDSTQNVKLEAMRSSLALPLPKSHAQPWVKVSHLSKPQFSYLQKGTRVLRD